MGTIILSRKEREGSIGGKSQTSMPSDPPWVHCFLRRIQDLNLFAEFSRIFQKTKIQVKYYFSFNNK